MLKQRQQISALFPFLSALSVSLWWVNGESQSLASMRDGGSSATKKLLPPSAAKALKAA